LLVKVLASTCN